jgi:hypothetical protein
VKGARAQEDKQCRRERSSERVDVRVVGAPRVCPALLFAERYILEKLARDEPHSSKLVEAHRPTACGSIPERESPVQTPSARCSTRIGSEPVAKSPSSHENRRLPRRADAAKPRSQRLRSRSTVGRFRAFSEPARRLTSPTFNGRSLSRDMALPARRPAVRPVSASRSRRVV